MKRLPALFHSAAAAAFVLLVSSVAAADSSCEATNDNRDSRCEITCGEGERAVCSDATGSNPPSCRCESDED